jgi:hypothetical protein
LTAELQLGAMEGMLEFESESATQRFIYSTVRGSLFGSAGPLSRVKMVKPAPVWLLHAIGTAAACAILVLTIVSYQMNRSRQASLMPLGPMYMPESFPFAFPEPFDPKKKSLSMVEVSFCFSLLNYSCP